MSWQDSVHNNTQFKLTDFIVVTFTVVERVKEQRLKEFSQILAILKYHLRKTLCFFFSSIDELDLLFLGDKECNLVFSLFESKRYTIQLLRQSVLM